MAPPNGDNGGKAAATKPSYYKQGSVELAVETPVMRQRLATRRILTHAGGSVAAERLMIVLVGLPARGKSFIGRKLMNYMLWRGNQCRIFNVGKYRRHVATNNTSEDTEKKNSKSTSEQKADFFDDTNETAAKLRKEAAELALKDTLQWLEGKEGIEEDTTTDDYSSSHDTLNEDSTDYPAVTINTRLSYSARRKFHRIAIFDATNSTNERRHWIMQECAKNNNKGRIGVLFLESICDDDDLLQENYQVKISSSPDFANMSAEEALSDLKSRISKYEARYETIPVQSHESFIKIFNLGSRLMVNHVYGRLAKVVLPAIMAWNTGSRPIYLCRAGETEAMESYMKRQHQTDDNNVTTQHKLEALVENRTRRKSSDRLGERGRRFRDALCDFIEQEGMKFMKRKQNHAGDAGSQLTVGLQHPTKVDTGTSIAGLYEEAEHPFANEAFYKDNDNESQQEGDSHLPLHCLVMSSTRPRAIETATWKDAFPVKDVTNLNPLDMGDFAGMDLASIREQYPVWYNQLQQDPYTTRFPGGESYGDLIDRLYSIVIDMEQQLGLAIAVSHVSVLQVLLSYFRSSPIHKCMDLEVPMHTVFKFVPLRGGGWLESQHALLPDDCGDTLKSTTLEMKDGDVPIWGDSRSCLPVRLEKN